MFKLVVLLVIQRDALNAKPNWDIFTIHQIILVLNVKIRFQIVSTVSTRLVASAANMVIL
jgi:hypothetical protein